MFHGYRRWLARHREVTNFDDDIFRRGTEKLSLEADGLPGPYGPPKGAIVVAYLDGRPVGAGAIRPLDAGTAELKRVFVQSRARGLGVGRRITTHLLRRAGRLGYESVRLDTLPGMRSAVALYRSLGFVEIPPYWASPYTGSLFFELRLRERR